MNEPIRPKPVDPRPALGSWAPGGYFCRCGACGCQFTGDKRATRCADCAYKHAGSIDVGVLARELARHASANVLANWDRADADHVPLIALITEAIEKPLSEVLTSAVERGWRPMNSVPLVEDVQLLLLHRTHGVVEGRYGPGSWHDHPEGREYDGPVWICGDDAYQVEIEQCDADPAIWYHNEIIGWLPREALPAAAPRPQQEPCPPHSFQYSFASDQPCIKCGAEPPKPEPRAYECMMDGNCRRDFGECEKAGKCLSAYPPKSAEGESHGR